MTSLPLPHTLHNTAFSDALLDPDTAIPSGVGKNGQAAPKRFGVYRNNVVVGLMDALKSAYPSLLAIMGEENFSRVARNFILASPPRSPMMQVYGQAFPEFLRDFKPLAKSPFLFDVAIAERCWLQAYHAPDAAILEPQQLGAVDPDLVMGMTFKVHPAAHLIQSGFPLCDLFDARNTWPCIGIDLANPQDLLITRPNYECLTTRVTRPQVVFLHALINLRTLAEAIETASRGDESFEPSMAISVFLQTGLFTSINLRAQQDT